MKKTISESTLKNIIKESVKKMLEEFEDDTYRSIDKILAKHMPEVNPEEEPMAEPAFVEMNESRLKKIISESVKKVLNEISADFAGKKMRDFGANHGFFSDEYKTLPYEDDAEPGQRAKDKHGNPGIKRHNGRFDTDADRYRRIGSQVADKRRKEKELDPLALKAKQVWYDNDLESEIEWGENEFAGDEIYGPCGGSVEFDGWEFNVEGSYEMGQGCCIESDTIEFTSPDGETGYFYL